MNLLEGSSVVIPALEGNAIDMNCFLVRYADFGELSGNPSLIKICRFTRSNPVIVSVTVCSTWILGFISMK